MMKINLKHEEALYTMIQAIKKSGPAGQAFIDGGISFNQAVLTACGGIHAKLMQLSDEAAEQFKADNQEFFGGFAWTYYMDWRKTRAKSCAHLLDMYNLLNIKLGVQHFVGETFYAGIPLVTSAEIDEAIQTCQVDDNDLPIGPEDDWFDHEKVGIDGQLHKTDKYGLFEPWSDPNDIYGDGTGVTLAELKAVTADDASQCLSCQWAGQGCNSQNDVGCGAYEKI